MAAICEPMGAARCERPSVDTETGAGLPILLFFLKARRDDRLLGTVDQGMPHFGEFLAGHV